ncbi:MAG: 50S ribosomal protein L35 [Candidatus Sungbacteria bacterium]|nr:50S ribosomal protein L35 [Candidatus Sungbacteria bacterium]
MARKAVLKRIKITKSGKLLHRRPGKNHFNAKASRKSQLAGKRTKEFTAVVARKLKAYI